MTRTIISCVFGDFVRSRSIEYGTNANYNRIPPKLVYYNRRIYDSSFKAKRPINLRHAINMRYHDKFRTGDDRYTASRSI